MQPCSYLDAFGVAAPPADEPVRCGDIVRTGLNVTPEFQVIAVHEDKVWLRDLCSGLDALTALRRCHRLPTPCGLA
jgi:hypothetical protein